MFLCLCTCRHGAGDDFSEVLFFKKKILFIINQKPFNLLMSLLIVHLFWKRK